jgi:hypothetical protein
VNIIDNSGRTVMTRKMDASMTGLQLDTSTLPIGTYWCQFIFSDNAHAELFIKQ